MFPIGIGDVDVVGFSQVKAGDLVQLPDGSGKFGLIALFHGHPQIVWLDAEQTEIDVQNRQPRQLVRFKYGNLSIGAHSEFVEGPADGSEVAGMIGIKESVSPGIFVLFDRLGRDASGMRRAKPAVGFLDLRTFNFEAAVSTAHFVVLEKWALLMGACDGASGERFRIYDNTMSAKSLAGRTEVR